MFMISSETTSYWRAVDDGLLRLELDLVALGVGEVDETGEPVADALDVRLVHAGVDADLVRALLAAERRGVVVDVAHQEHVERLQLERGRAVLDDGLHHGFGVRVYWRAWRPSSSKGPGRTRNRRCRTSSLRSGPRLPPGLYGGIEPLQLYTNRAAMQLAAPHVGQFSDHQVVKLLRSAATSRSSALRDFSRAKTTQWTSAVRNGIRRWRGQTSTDRDAFLMGPGMLVLPPLSCCAQRYSGLDFGYRQVQEGTSDQGATGLASKVRPPSVAQLPKDPFAFNFLGLFPIVEDRTNCRRERINDRADGRRNNLV